VGVQTSEAWKNGDRHLKIPRKRLSNSVEKTVDGLSAGPTSSAEISLRVNEADWEYSSEIAIAVGSVVMDSLGPGGDHPPLGLSGAEKDLTLVEGPVGIVMRP
jgi:hypothetical protein